MCTRPQSSHATHPDRRSQPKSATAAVRPMVARLRLVEPRRLDQVIDRHALPFRPQLAPLGDAMDVDGDLGLRQGLKLLPGPPASERSPVLQRQGPLLEWRTRRRAGAQHREVVGDELAGRNPISFGLGTAPAREASGRRRHERCLRGLRIRRTRNPRLNTGGSVRLIFTLSVSVLVAHLRPTLQRNYSRT